MIISPAIVDEYGQVLFRDRIRKLSRWSGKEVYELMQLITDAAEINVPGKLQIRASRDPKDDKFLIAAIERKADYIISGDDDLLSLEEIEEIEILTPAKFLKLL